MVVALAPSSIGWKHDHEPGSMSQLALNIDLSPVRPYRFQRDRQTQSGATPRFFRREKRLKDLRDLLRVHPAAGIGKFHPNERSMVWVCRLVMGRGPYHQSATSRHRIERVFDEIDEYFLELLGIGVDFFDLLAPLGDERDASALELRLEERDAFRNTRVQIKRSANRLRSPGIQQHVLDNFRCSFDLRLHRL